ncbi:beta-ketoacyl reductase, partial [Actinoalloteichus caeruleus]
TRGAVATTPEADITDLPAAAAWGLVRSAQTENPGRLVLVDLGVDGDAERLPAVLASGEPQVAIRDGQLLVPRLVTSTAESVVPETRHGTVLVTGAGGALATLVARHLAMSGVPNLLLVSRRGTSAPGTVELLADLRELGTTAQVVACDVADRDALAGALERVPAERPLTGVVHTAGVLADGMLASLDAERVSAVLRPKVDGAWNLHELTRDLDLSLFTVFSSASGVLGALGQANYAAANAFLDGLAQHRRASGLPARSLAWGPWADGGMAGRLADAEATRMARAGLPPLSVEQGLALLDAAATVDRAALVPARLDLPALRARAAVEPLPPLFGELVPVAAGRRRAGTASGSSLT